MIRCITLLRITACGCPIRRGDGLVRHERVYRQGKGERGKKWPPERARQIRGNAARQDTMNGPGTDDTDVERRPVTDRKLGDEWLDWDGRDDAVVEFNEKPGIFSRLALGALLLWILLFQLAWYMTKPRVEQWSPSLSLFLDWSLIIAAVVVFVVLVMEVVMLMGFKRSCFPYVWCEGLLLSLLPGATWLGKRYGINRDRVSNSFIKAHNLLVRAHRNTVDASRLLILLPRCLKKEIRRMVIDRAEKMEARVVTAGGGEDARKAVREFRPSFIVAVACERDLVSGIKDLAQKIPLLAITNKRPEGPCKNTGLHEDQLEEVFTFLEWSARKKRPTGLI